MSTQTQSTGSKQAEEHQSIAKFKDNAITCPEFSLGPTKWVFWEQYEAAPGNFKKTTGTAWHELIQEVAWFGDIVSFWQIWQSLPISNLENYFFDRKEGLVPVYEIVTDLKTKAIEKKRIYCLSLFQEGIKPYWDHRGNAFGSEFRLSLPFREHPEKAEFNFLNKLWEEFTLDLISHRMPHVDQIAGIRISDKSRGGEFVIRLEVWLKFPSGDTDPRGKEIKNFITKEYLEKQGMTNLAEIRFENHNKGDLYPEGPM